MVLSVFLLCLLCACTIAPSYCPDEEGRMLLSDYIYQTGGLPTGNEPETFIDGWGFSYALRPYLSSLIGAIGMRAVSWISSSEMVLLAASRIGSILSITFACVFALKAGLYLFQNRWSARLYAIVICFLPQVIFLGSYQNNDMISLASVCMMLYYLIYGSRTRWCILSCVGLGVSMSICALSYYSAYFWLVTAVGYCVTDCLRNASIKRKSLFIASRALLILVIGSVLAGSFFIRNALLHNGDFLGITSERVSREIAAANGERLYQYNNLCEQGYSLDEFFAYNDYWWIQATIQSFIGVFGYMDIWLPDVYYFIYYIVLIVGAVLYVVERIRCRKYFGDASILGFMLLASAGTFALHTYQSYCRDYQPQGRYVITLILPLAYLMAKGMDTLHITSEGKESVLHKVIQRVQISRAFSFLWLLLFIGSFAGTMVQMM